MIRRHSTNVVVRVELDVREKLEDLAIERSVTVSDVARGLLYQVVDREPRDFRPTGRRYVRLTKC